MKQSEEEYCIIIEGTLNKEGKTAINAYKSNSLAAKCTKQKSLKMQGELPE